MITGFSNREFPADLDLSISMEWWGQCMTEENSRQIKKKKDIPMVNVHMKRCSTILVFGIFISFGK